MLHALVVYGECHSQLNKWIYKILWLASSRNRSQHASVLMHSLTLLVPPTHCSTPSFYTSLWWHATSVDSIPLGTIFWSCRNSYCISLLLIWRKMILKCLAFFLHQLGLVLTQSKLIPTATIPTREHSHLEEKRHCHTLSAERWLLPATLASVKYPNSRNPELQEETASLQDQVECLSVWVLFLSSSLPWTHSSPHSSVGSTTVRHMLVSLRTEGCHFHRHLALKLDYWCLPVLVASAL